MLKSYFVVALRSLRRRKGYAALNVAGLAVGLACCLLLALFLRHELGFDTFAPEADRTFRVVTAVEPPDAETQLLPTNGWPLGDAVQAAHPEVEALTNVRGPWEPDLRTDGGLLHPTVLHAGPSFFDVLGFPLVAGDPVTALAEPYALVLTESLARTVFGNASAVGQSLLLSTDSTAYTVTGVAADPPSTSHVQFDALASFATFGARNPDFDPSEQWFTLQITNYLRLREGADVPAFAETLAGVYDRHFGAWNGYELEARLEPLTGVYLHSEAGNGLGPRGSVDAVVLLTAVALFILLIAAINFVNLATARATERAREVGVRKAVGSSRGAIVGQFLGESVVLTAFGGLVGFGLAVAALPTFNRLAGRAFEAGDLGAPWAAALVVGLIGMVGVGAGLYPALVLSSYRPTEALKGRFATGRQGVRLRQGLVVVQFALSIGLVVATFSVLRQLDYMQTQDLGFAADETLVVEAGRVPGSLRQQRAEAFQQRLEGIAGVRAVSFAGAAPGFSGWAGQVTFRGEDERSSVSMEHVMADAAFADALGLRVIAGRGFDAGRASDGDGVLLNVEAVQALGWPSPEAALGQRVVSPGSQIDGPVIGVVADYHQHGLRQPIPALAVSQQNPWSRGLFLVRFAPARRASVEAEVRAAWTAFFPDYEPTIGALGSAFAAQYDEERRLAQTFAVFAGLAVLLACLGLLGLAAYATAQRTKEIGIRKVLGASVGSIVALVSKEFVLLVGVAFVVAVPVAWLAMDRWLEDFAYRVDLGPLVFLGAGLLALLIAVATVSAQALRAATSDPVRSLRYE